MDTSEYIDKRNQLLKEGKYAEVEELDEAFSAMDNHLKVNKHE
ncbi:MAG: hypothetical protein ACOCQ4_01690 [bacterium]